MPNSRRPKSHRRRLILIIAGVAVLLGAGGGGFYLLNAGKATATSVERTAEVTTQTLKETVGSTGTIEPMQRADLSFAVSGTVDAVKVAVGDRVKASAVLATIDDAALKADLDTAEADLAAAQDQLDEAEDDGSDAEVESAEAQVALKYAQRDQAEKALDQATLTSPIDGTVAVVDIAPGDNVGGGDASGGSGAATGSGSTESAAITVISTTSYEVQTSVTGTDLTKIKKGLQAEITPTGATEPLYGTVASIGVLADEAEDGTSATFAVTIKITGKPKGVYAGSSADVSIIVRQIPDAITVPTAAITTNADGKPVVRKKSGEATTETVIEIGDSFGESTQVLSGLSAGDQVVITMNLPVGGGNGGGGMTQLPGGGGMQQGPPGGGNPPARTGGGGR